MDDIGRAICFVRLCLVGLMLLALVSAVLVAVVAAGDRVIARRRVFHGRRGSRVSFP